MPQTLPTRDKYKKEDARITKSRDALCTSLLSLIESRPYDSITIQEITHHAQVGYATFYRHFTSKPALLNHIAAAQIRNLVELAMPVLATRNSSDACLIIFHYVHHHRCIWQTLLNGGAASTVRDEIIQIARELAVSQPLFGHETAKIPHNLAFRFAASGMIDVLSWWLSNDEIDEADGAYLLDRLVITPLVGSPN